MIETIQGNHMMMGLWLGLMPDELPDEKKTRALAIAWVKFQKEFPAVILSPKQQAIIAMVSSHSVAYGPMVLAQLAKMRAAAVARRQAARNPGFNIPAQNPAEAPADSAPTERATPTGTETVILSGAVPDSGRLDFTDRAFN